MNQDSTNGKTVSNIITITENIKKSISCNLVYPAFFMALALPDICGKLKYKKLSGNKGCKERYMKWFDEYVNMLLNPITPYLEEKEGLVFDSNMCYRMRCSLLHAGETDIGEEVKIDNFSIDLTSNHLHGSLLQSGMDLWPNDSGNSTRTLFYVRGRLIADCILQGTRTFLDEIMISDNKEAM